MKYILILNILIFYRPMHLHCASINDSCTIFKDGKYYNCNDTSLFSGWIYTKFEKTSTILSKFYVKMGKPDSIFYQFNKRGKLILMDVINARIGTNEKIEYYKNNKIRKSIMYIKDIPVIERTYFNDNFFSLKNIIYYDTNGIIDSFNQFYKYKSKKEILVNNNRQRIFSIFSYKDGKLNGINYFFYKNGMIREKIFYNSGIWVKTELYTKTGKFQGELKPFNG